MSDAAESVAPPAERDDFEAKNELYGIGRVADLYPRLAELRERCPVHPGSLSEKFGMPGPDSMLAPEEQQWSVLGYAHVDEVLRDPETFSSSWYEPSLGKVIGATILQMDPPVHRRYRLLISGAFTKKECDRWEDDFVRDIVDSYIDRFAHAGRADLAADFAFHYPINVVAVAAGLPVDDIPRFYRDTAVLTNAAVSEQQRLAASHELGELVRGLVGQRRREPTQDLISVLVQATLREDENDTRTDARLTDDEIVAFMRLLVPAGAQTTYRALTNLLYGLLTHPDQLDALRADRSLVPQAIEEGLRWEVPLTFSGRTVTRDTEIAGCPVRAGQFVNVSIGAANHDSTRWDRPDEFDIFRPQRPHLAFGVGPHVCLGIHAARMELRVALERLLDRLPNLRLDPDAAREGITGVGMRTAVRIPVLFDPA